MAEISERDRELAQSIYAHCMEHGWSDDQVDRIIAQARAEGAAAGTAEREAEVQRLREGYETISHGVPIATACAIAYNALAQKGGA